MERGQGSSSHPFHKGKSTSTAGLNSTNVSGNNTNINSNNNPQPQSFLREQDQYMPIANVIRIMRRILPTHAKISDDAKETIQECVSEFISFVTGEANDRCHREQRKTITAGDLIWAMGKLGFDTYVDPLTIYLARYRQLESDKSSHCEPIVRRRIECAPMTMTPPMPLPMMGGPAYGPFVNMGQNQALFDAAALDGYYGGEGSAASGPSSSQPPFPNYDPFGHFK